jgi:hypothetical protein
MITTSIIKEIATFGLACFICSLFNDAFQQLRLNNVEWKGDKWVMNWKWFGRKRLWPNFKELYQHSCRGAEENQENFSQDRRFPGRDINPVPPEYEAGVFTSRPRRSVLGIVHRYFVVCVLWAIVLMMEALSINETSVNFYQTTRFNIRQDSQSSASTLQRQPEFLSGASRI